MNRRKRHVVASIIAFALIVVGPTWALPKLAYANDFCAYEDTTPPTVTGFGPSTVTLGLEPELVEFTVQGEDECGIAGWSIDTPDRLLFFVYQQSPMDNVVPFRNKDAGPTLAKVQVHDPAYNVATREFPFRLLRHSRWVNSKAGPEPVKKGDRVTITGTLQRADWTKDTYVRFGGPAQRATVQFRAEGTEAWIPVKTVDFGAAGRISTQVTVKREVARNGWYRLHFAGSTNTSGATSAPHFVAVR